MSHTLKKLLNIIQNRIYKRCENELGAEQFGFRGGLGTIEALFFIRLLVQKICEFKKSVFIYFIDFEKAFDQVKHGLLFQYLESIIVERNVEEEWEYSLIRY